MNAQDTRTFRVLRDTDIAGLSSTLRGKDTLGDGYIKLPWYWRISMSENQDDAEEISTSGTAVREEYEESEQNERPAHALLTSA